MTTLKFKQRCGLVAAGLIFASHGFAQAKPSSLKLKTITDRYSHSWIAFPVISGKKIGEESILTVGA